MAIITVGFGKTHATIIAARTAASNNDTLVISEEDAFGGRDYASEGRMTIDNKGLTLRSDVTGERNFVSNFVLSGSFNFTIQDFHFVGGDKRFSPKNIINVNVNGITLIERCVIQSSTEELITVNGTGFTCTVNNCILVGGSSGNGFRVLGTGTFTVNYCTVLFCRTNAFLRSAATCIANNCLAYSNGNDWSGTWTGKNNATTDASGAIGTNSVNGITKAKAGFAYHFSPASATLFPNDFRAIEGEMAAGGIKDAGDPVSGVTEDIDGRTRDTSTPNIGASEGFTGFGSGVPPKPDAVAVSDPTTDGDLTITWTNSGSYIAGDIMVAHDKDASNAVLGGGDATTGTMRISKLTNGQQKNILLRAVRP